MTALLPNELRQEFPKILWQHIGSVPGIKIHLGTCPDIKPIYLRKRPVPYAQQKLVEEELETWEKEGIIEPINTSDWGSPQVVTPKPDGGV